MSEERLFTDEELKELATSTMEKIRAAVEKGDKEETLDFVNQLYNEFTGLHDGYMCWISGLLTHIYNTYGGSDAVEAAEREAHIIESRIASAFKPVNKKDVRSVFLSLLSGVRGHVHQPMNITEDDDKLVIAVDPCGSGGRLLAIDAYSPQKGLIRIKEPHNITWQMGDFPIYCVHCPIMGALSFERNGDFSFVKTFAETETGSRCEYVFYKDPAQIPEEYYTRIGKQKPGKAWS
jgi:hypothetical protein